MPEAMVSSRGRTAIHKNGENGEEMLVQGYELCGVRTEYQSLS